MWNPLKNVARFELRPFVAGDTMSQTARLRAEASVCGLISPIVDVLKYGFVFVSLIFNVVFLDDANAEPPLPNLKQRPSVGFVLVAWDEASQANSRDWLRSLQQLHDADVRDVTLVTYRFVHRESGKISFTSAFGLDSPPRDEVLRAAFDAGKRLGMRVSLNPLVEIDNAEDLGGQWRGELDFAAEKLTDFFVNYGEYIRSMAELVKTGDGYRLYVGSELQSLVANRAARPHWRELIRNIRQELAPPVKLSYASNFDTADNVPFWSELDEIAVDAYYSLATPAKAKGPAKPTVETIKEGWRGPLRKLRKLSQKHKRPIMFAEWGVVPFDQTTANPWDWMPTRRKDPQEQLNAYQATLEVVESEGEWLTGITCWHWAMPSNEGSHYRIAPQSKISQLITGYTRRTIQQRD